MEEEYKFKELDEGIGHFKESTAKSKDYHKFIIGLSTGTLIFSVTFIKEFIMFPEFKLILVAGWVGLLISIITGVLILPLGDELESQIRLLKTLFQSKEKIGPITKKELKEHYMKLFLKSYIGPLPENEEKAKEINEFLNRLSFDKMKIMFEKIALSGLTDPLKLKQLKEILKELVKFLSIAKLEERYSNLPYVLKRIRISIYKLIILGKLVKYAFFFGIVAISIFSIINFLPLN